MQKSSYGVTHESDHRLSPKSSFCDKQQFVGVVAIPWRLRDVGCDVMLARAATVKGPNQTNRNFGSFH